jgi:hypothetical protein
MITSKIISQTYVIYLKSASKTELRGFILQANYTDRATAACWWS